MFKQLRFWLTLLFILIVVIIIGLGIFLYMAAKIDISQIEQPLPSPTTIYDRYGEATSRISSKKLEPVPLDEIPIYLQNAIIAVEDKRFYEHKGVDIWAIGRAVIKNFKSKDYVEGGSTITQQLAKNVFLPSDKTISRKLKEAALAIKIDYTYDKEYILELYLNKIYFGEGTWGVQEAAQVYFGKNVQDLTLSESALLAGLPKAPTHYSPLKNKEKALARRDLVLSLMKEQNFITENIYNEAISEPLTLRAADHDDLKGKHPSYVDYIFQEAYELYGITEEEILTGGLQIYTHLDPVVQNAMEAVYQDDRFFPTSSEDQLIQSGAVVLDPYTGGIRGIVGHRGDHIFRGFNRGTQLMRQPGSAFKPLVVYTPALEMGYRPDSILYDGKLNIGGYQPRDWDNRTRGTVTLHEAVVQSWNIPAVWLLNEIGIERGIDYVTKMGIPLSKEDRNLGIALGGLHEGVSPLHMAQAFGTFANLGVMNQAYAIKLITTKDGQVLVEAEPKSQKIMSPVHAYTMTRLLEDVVKKGTGKKATLNRPTAGKTGTTQLPDIKEFSGLKGAKDAWFVGYTPELVAAVWMGYDKTDRSHYLTTSGGNYPALVFQEIMNRSLAGKPIIDFDIPDEFYLNPYIDLGNNKNEVNDGDVKKEKKKKEKEKEKQKEKEAKRKEKERKEKEKERKKKKKEVDDD